MMAVLLLPFLALFTSVAGITTNSWTSVNRWRYGGFGSPFSSRARTIFRSVDRTEPWSPLWTDTGTVPNLISQVGSSWCVCSVFENGGYLRYLLANYLWTTHTASASVQMTQSPRVSSSNVPDFGGVPSLADFTL